jgi:hypothetical protein
MQKRGAANNDYLSSQKRCLHFAKHAPGDEVRQAWLNLAESYETLLMLASMENNGALIGGQRLEGKANGVANFASVETSEPFPVLLGFK